MVPVDIVGRTGRAVTEVGAAGQVEIDGRVYEAMTARPPVNAGDAVEVTGWRLVGEASYVLSVRRPGDDTPAAGARGEGAPAAPGRPVPPAPPPGSDQAERIQELERRLAAQQRHQEGALGTVAAGAALGLAAGFLFSCVTYRGQGLILNPLAFLLWAAGGAVVGIVAHLARAPGGGGH